ncbi:Calx-beta domain-containing protein [Leifsonia poae]|uniref:Calx-beta domain-containing protein n=1 Tax=Leifsonia poae TaxID=110933 RepID=UPI003D669D15
MTRLHLSIHAAVGVAALGLALAGVAVLAPAAAASAAPVAPPTVVPNSAAVTPLVDCVADSDAGSGQTTRTIVFGYRNVSATPIPLAAGTVDNFLTPGPLDRGQPSSFLPGEHHGAFAATVDSVGGGSLIWSVGDNYVIAPRAGTAIPSCDTVTTVALSAPSTVASGDTVTLTAAVSRMQLGAPDSGQVSFAVDSGTPTVASVDATGVARAVVPAPAAGSHTVVATFIPATGSLLLTSHAQADFTVSASTGALSVTPSGFSADKRQAFVTVTRASGAGVASVDYTTADGTAKAGSDYTAAQGTVTLVAGQLSATISIPVADRAAGSGEATFFVLLQRATAPVDVAGATVKLPAVTASGSTTVGNVTSDTSGHPGASGGGSDSALPAGDPTASGRVANTASDLVLMLGGALLAVGGILGVFGLFKFGSTRNAQA